SALRHGLLTGRCKNGQHWHPSEAALAKRPPALPRRQRRAGLRHSARADRPAGPHRFRPARLGCWPPGPPLRCGRPARWLTSAREEFASRCDRAPLPEHHRQARPAACLPGYLPDGKDGRTLQGCGAPKLLYSSPRLAAARVLPHPRRSGGRRLRLGPPGSARAEILMRDAGLDRPAGPAHRLTTLDPRGLLFYLRRRRVLNVDQRPRYTGLGWPGSPAQGAWLRTRPGAFCTSACGAAPGPACTPLRMDGSRAAPAADWRRRGAPRTPGGWTASRAGCTGWTWSWRGVFSASSTARTGGPSGTWAARYDGIRWAWRSSRGPPALERPARRRRLLHRQIRGQPLKLVLPPEHSGSVLSAVVYHSVRQALGGQAGSRRCTCGGHICIQAGGSPVCLCDQLSVMKDGVCVPSGDAGRKPGRKQPEPVAAESTGAAQDGSDAAAGQQQSLVAAAVAVSGLLLCLAAGAALCCCMPEAHRRLNRSTEATGLPKINSICVLKLPSHQPSHLNLYCNPPPLQRSKLTAHE
uniref:EGF-like domain-containing protein n=1 Tax=Macrostomum lignano TaxID=282301 RepID=A0A1I8JRF0_9PLAT